jgi:transcriptional regulator with XRE-family HTH domain
MSNRQIADVRQHDVYHVEAAKVDFALEINRLLESTQTKKAELAARLGVSAPMVSKLLRGDANVTIETMVKAARALGASLYIKLAPDDCGAHLLDTANVNRAHAFGNEGRYHWLQPANGANSFHSECANDEAESVAA